MSTSETPKLDAALRYYVAMVDKATNGQDVCKIAEQALDSPAVFVFAELLENPKIKQSPSSLQDKLGLFAYGTYLDYKANPAKYGTLTTQQLTKLKQLTIISLSEHSKLIPYATLISELDLPAQQGDQVRQLEDLVMACVYQGLITGKLDQAKKHLEVHSAIGRDLQSSQLQGMRDVLAAWVQKSDQLLALIDERVQYTGLVQEEHKKAAEEFESQLKTVKETVKAAMEADMHDSQAVEMGMGMMGPGGIMAPGMIMGPGGMLMGPGGMIMGPGGMMVGPGGMDPRKRNKPHRSNDPYAEIHERYNAQRSKRDRP